MWLKTTAEALGRIDRPLIALLKNIAMGILAVMMFLTAADVILRYVFNRPIAGAYEIIEFLMAALVSFSVAYCAYENSHISVDIFLERFSKRTRMLLACLTTILTFVFFLLVAWQTFLYIADQYSSRLTSAVLLIPEYPFVGTVAVAFGILCLVLLANVFSAVNEVREKWTQW